MVTIEKHISDLLCLHDCVIVPGLGGFVANHSSAVIQEERHLFVPPAKEIGFNRSLSHNDGLLVNHLCRREGCSYQEGMDRIGLFVAELMEVINRNETKTLKGIGDFRKDALGNILFAAQPGNSFLPESFGLGQFQFEPLDKVSAIGNSDEPVRRLLKSRSPRYWASIAAMMAGLFFFTSELKMPEQAQVNEGSLFPLAYETQLSAVSREGSEGYVMNSLRRDEATEKQTVDEKDEVSAVLAEPTASSLEVHLAGYHLIAASFTEAKPAQKTLVRLQSNGFPEACILQENRRFRVALCSFPNKSAAIEQLYQIREIPRFSEVWLWKH